MFTPGQVSLTKFGNDSFLPIGAAGTFTCTAITEVAGALGLTLVARLNWIAGGTTVKAYVRTRFGGTWVDIACFAFGAAAAVKGHNLNFQTPRTLFPVTDGALADDTIVDGPIGDALETKVVVVGAYTGGTTLAISGQLR